MINCSMSFEQVEMMLLISSPIVLAVFIVNWYRFGLKLSALSVLAVVLSIIVGVGFAECVIFCADN